MEIFSHFSFSYRDLPVRYFEPATIYRDEKSKINPLRDTIRFFIYISKEFFRR